MRIGMMADAYKPHISGVTNYIALNKQYLERLSHQVYVFTFGGLDYRDEEANIYRSPGVPLTDSGYHVGLGYTRRARKMLYTMEIVHLHHPFLSGSLALSYCKPRGIPIVCTNHTRYDLYARVYLPYLPHEIAEKILQAYLPAFYRACDLVIAPSEGMRKVMERQGVDVPIEVIPNGVDLTPFQYVNQPINRAELGLRPEDVILVFVGRVGREKNLSFLLEAFAATADVVDNAKLMIIGSGPERDHLAKWVNEKGMASRVRFTGFIPYEQLPRYLAIADIFVTASVTEVHPLTLIEAMASGLPVLGIVSPGVSDTVQDGVTGLLASDDLTMFTTQMVKMVTEHEQRRSMGVQARQVAQAYAIERTAQILLSHYQRLVASRKETVA
jgi:glycosyltransferase involved in cell wall biosynthesis